MTDDTATEARWSKIPPKVRAILEANGYFKMTKRERVAAAKRFLAEFQDDGPPEPWGVCGTYQYVETGLSADEAAAYLLAQVRHQPIPEAVLAKLKAASPDPAVVESVTAGEVMRAIAAPFLGRPNPETIECVGDKLTMEGTLSIRYTLTQEDGKWSMEDRDGLELSGETGGNDTPAKEVRVFLEDLLFAWDHYAMAPDSMLTSDAQELKRRLLGLFGLEAKEDGR